MSRRAAQRIGLWIALAMCGVRVSSQPAPQTAPSVQVSVSQQEVSVGEAFFVQVQASGPPGTTWTFPEQAGDDNVELVSAAPDAAPSPGKSAAPPPADTWRYRASVFSVKDPMVPAIQVRYRLADGSTGAVASAPSALRLRSLLPKDPQARTLEDVRPPLALSIGWPFWVALGAGLALVSGLLWLALRRRKPASVTPALPALSAEAEARQALDLLERSGRLANADWRAVYIALTEIAKRYLERRLAAPILEMTSAETLAHLREHAHGDELLVPLRGLMGAADQVKFARGASQLEEAHRHLAAVRALIAALEARLTPPAAATANPPTGTRAR